MSFVGDLCPILAGVPHDHNGAHYLEVYAHRGGRSFFPEHSLMAYHKSLALGVNWVDMDVGLTKDGILVAYHDLWLNPDILRKNGKFIYGCQQEFLQQQERLPCGIDVNLQPYLIKNLTLDELQQYDNGKINPDSPYAKYFSEQGIAHNSHILSLQQIVDYVSKHSHQQINFQIEIKNDPFHPKWTASTAEFATKINQFIIKNDLLTRIEVQSFDWQVLYELHNINPEIKLAFVVASDDIARMHSHDHQAAGLWSGGKLLKDYNNSLPQMIKALGGSCYEPEDIGLTKDDLDEAHRLGLKVVVWSWPENSGIVFDQELVDKLILWGVDGIITDNPAKLNRRLAAHNLPVPKCYTQTDSK